MQQTAILLTFILYLLFMLGVGVYAYKQTHNLSDYILGGRGLGPWVGALSAGASDMSGWLLMGLPGAIYMAGFSETWIVIGLAFGAYLNWKIIAPRLRIYTEHANNSLTIPEFLTQRFHDDGKLLRIISASIILVFFTLYVASGLTAGAKLFEASFGLDYHFALAIGGAVIVSYTFVGGFLAVSWTDLIQGLLMALALIITPAIILVELGSVDNAMTSIQMIDVAEQSLRADWFSGESPLDYIFSISFASLMAWGLGYFGQPHLLARFMAIKSIKEIHSARKIAMSWMVVCMLGAVSIGLFSIAFFYQTEQALLLKEDPEQVFILACKVLFNPWFSGVLLAAILAAVMSTVDSQLLVSSSAITEDFYRGLIKPNASDKELVMISRASVLSIALIAMIIAADKDSSILSLVANAWAGFGAAFGPVIIFSLLWRRTTKWGALSGMILGAITVLLWSQFKEQLPGNLSQLYEMIPGFAIASLSIILVSIWGPKNQSKVGDDYDYVRLSITGNI